ncbi:hypothetical protein AcV7_001348 [Taiwanofungus camphoratus]|nr:hypothetical protein AcW2_000148 [Antrodia cinnamomea]KAI0962517.1 hypothetical protein AcV7_001348 [Antrodia cinnamomea]
MLATSSLSVSRLMLSIHSLAATLSMEPDWLLNNAELSRVRWKKWAREGELLVEIYAIEEEHVELDDVMHGERPDTPYLHSTRVDVYDDEVLPGAEQKMYPRGLSNALSRSGSNAHSPAGLTVKSPHLTLKTGVPFRTIQTGL